MLAGCLFAAFNPTIPWFLLQLLDCESDRAVSSSTDTMWELSVLRRSFHPALNAFAADAIAMAPVPPSHAPKDLVHKYDASLGVFTPPIKPPPIEPIRRHYLKSIRKV
jgi:hypothetical protein